MASMNRVFLMGNLTRDPEVRYLPNGKPVADLNLAIDRKYRTSTGEERQDTCYVAVTVWGRQGEVCGEYLVKGSPVLIEGSLKYEQWEKDGQKHSRLKVNADRVQFLGRPAGEPDEAGPAAAPAANAPAASAPAASAPAATPAAPAADALAADDDDLPF